jgi:CRP-like cAMP-binding protein
MAISLVRKLEQFTPLSETEKRALQTAPTQVRDVTSRSDLVSEGDCPTDISLLNEGFACRYKLLRDGRRQITALLIPGDICDLRAFLLGRMDHGVATLSRCHVSRIAHQTVFEIIETHPRIGLGLWRDTMLDGAIYRQWLTNIGRRSAYQRIAHLLCEVWWRLQAVGGTCGDSYELPVTQTDIGDAMGLSVVHVNRTLQATARRRPHFAAVECRRRPQLAPVAGGWGVRSDLTASATSINAGPSDRRLSSHGKAPSLGTEPAPRGCFKDMAQCLSRPSKSSRPQMDPRDADTGPRVT